MHKVLLTHQADDPDYKPPRRYIYQTGSVFKVVIEFEKLVVDDSTPMSEGGLICYGISAQPDFFPFIVPGTSTMDILKEIK